jgi:uncharacterized membrane protein
MNDINPPAPMPTPPPESGGTTQATPPSNTVLMSVLAYLGILVVIPLLVAKEDMAVKFHVKQGLVLCIGQVLLWVAGGMGYSLMLGILAPILMLGNLALFVLAIIGIINAVKMQQKELPIVGGLAAHLPL